MERPPRDSTVFVRRFGIALIVLFTAIIIALIVVLFTVDFDGDDDDEPPEGTRDVPAMIVPGRLA